MGCSFAKNVFAKEHPFRAPDQIEPLGPRVRREFRSAVILPVL